MKLNRCILTIFFLQTFHCLSMQELKYWQSQKPTTIDEFLKINTEKLNDLEFEQYEKDFIILLSPQQTAPTLSLSPIASNAQTPTQPAICHTTQSSANLTSLRKPKKNKKPIPIPTHNAQSEKKANPTKKTKTPPAKKQPHPQIKNQKQVKEAVLTKQSINQEHKEQPPKKPAQIIITKTPEQEFAQMEWDATKALMNSSEFNVKSIRALKQKMTDKCYEEESYTTKGTVYVKKQPIDWIYSMVTGIIDFYPEGFPSSSTEESEYLYAESSSY